VDFEHWKTDRVLLDEFNRWCEILMPHCMWCGEHVVRGKSKKYCSPTCAQSAALSKAHKAYPDYARGRFLIFNRDGFRCIYCGRSSFENEAGLHCDHVVPASRGGNDVAANLVTACSRCNLEKQASTLLVVDELLAEVARRNQRAQIPPGTEIRL
jgi:5-methylcytosine-specific restriction endonuclease McrA